MISRALKATLFVVAICLAPYGVSQAKTPPVVNVGATPTAVPFNFLDPATGKLSGVMIDVANAVGEEAGFKPNLMSIPFSSLVPALQTKKIDVISSAFSKSAEREKVVDFTQTVFHYGEGVVVPASDNTDYKTLTDLKGKTVGVQIGVIYVEPLKKTIGPNNVKMYDSMNDMINDVNLGRVQVAMGDGPIMAYIVNEQHAKGVRFVKDYKPSLSTTVGLAVRKDDTSRLNSLNSALTKLKDNGTIKAILAKWNIEN